MNALAEYLTAPAGRRRTIVAEQKNPKAFRVAYYAEAEDAIVGALAGRLDVQHLDRGRAKILAMQTGKAWDMSRRQTQLEAVESARSFIQRGDASELRELTTARRRTPPFLIGSVAVSVRPELLLESGPGSVDGAIKLYFSKTSPLSEERARYAGAILQMAVESLRSSRLVAHRKCLVFDVFAQRLYQAPRTYQRRRHDINAACTEIAALWSV